MFFSLFLQSLIVFMATIFLISYFIKVAPKLSLVDVPNERSSHKQETPRGAGIVFGFVFILALLFINSEHFSNNYLIIFALLIVYLTGIYDDIKTIKARTKFLWIIIATAVAFFDGVQVTTLGTFFGYEIPLSIFALPFTIFAVVGFTNAVNLTDGLDGLAGSISIIMLLTLAYIGYINDDEFLVKVPLLMVFCLFGFLVFNWNPAKVFMGDSGSLFLGFVVSILAIRALEYINPVAIIFFAGIPLLDTLVVIRRRRQRGISPFEPDKNHLHHILYKYKLDKKFTVNMLIMLQLAFSMIFILIHKSDGVVTLILFLLLYIIFFNLFDPRARIRTKNRKKKKKKKKVELKIKNFVLFSL